MTRKTPHRAPARLGSDEELASAMLEQPGMRSVAYRAPWAVFGVLPPIATILCAFAVVAPLALIAHLVHLLGEQPLPAPQWFRMLALGVTETGNLLLAPLLATALVVLAWRQRLAVLWPLIGIALIALMGIRFDVQFPETQIRGMSVGIGALLWLLHPDTVANRVTLSLTQTFLTFLPALGLLYARQRMRLFWDDNAED